MRTHLAAVEQARHEAAQRAKSARKGSTSGGSGSGSSYGVAAAAKRMASMSDDEVVGMDIQTATHGLPFSLRLLDSLRNGKVESPRKSYSRHVD